MSIRRIFWNPPPESDLAGHKVYWDDAAVDLASLIKQGTANLAADIPITDAKPNEYLFDDDGLAPGDYQFMVTAYDETGNESDPYQHPGWALVVVAEPVDTVPPSPPSGGGIELVS